ncbi:esterase/lipase family protein [Streptomyces sp. NPDC057137]|uniref:esterase/lipase family protein n=1 Tax=Streptomyces sp. NPDC057137 TaxID=3346030 RepID=UPI003642D827
MMPTEVQKPGTTPGGDLRQTAIVFVHGLFSSPATWTPLRQELSAIPAVADQFDFLFFEYATRPVTWNPLRRMPDLDTVAESLRSFIGDLATEHERVVLVTHSQGGPGCPAVSVPHAAGGPRQRSRKDSPAGDVCLS